MRALFRYSLRLYLASLLLLFGSLPDASGQTLSPEKALIAVPSLALSMLPVSFAQDRGLFKKEGTERDRTVNYIATRWKLDQELAAQSYDIMVRSFSRDGSASAKSIQNVIDSTRSRLQINRAISVNDVAAFSLLGEVQKELSLR